MLLLDPAVRTISIVNVLFGTFLGESLGLSCVRSLALRGSHSVESAIQGFRVELHSLVEGFFGFEGM